MREQTNQPTVSASADDTTNNHYAADALDRLTRLRAIFADLPGATNLPRLRPSDIRLANITSAEALEQAAVMAATTKGVGGDLANASAFRDAVNYVFAYQQLREEMTAALRQIDMAIVHNKYLAVKLARPLYQVMKAYAASEVGDAMKPYVQQMQRVLARPKRKPLATPPASKAEVTTAKP